MHRVRLIMDAKANPLRRLIQIVSAVFLNGYIYGFISGKIYTGEFKNVCVPVLNCYSCPGAVGSCPVGALQNTVGMLGKIPFYTLGILALFGVLLGRAVCGLLCPFGFIQDLLSKIPARSIRVNKRLDYALKYIKYAVLFGIVIALPVVAYATQGYSQPYFCEYVCPAGTLEAGLPLLAADQMLRGIIGNLFALKLSVLIIIIAVCIFIPRAFCRYVCPLGAFYGLFNKLSLYKMRLNRDKCTNCLKCVRACPMQVDVLKDINNIDCIRCSVCADVCPEGAISSPLDKLKKELASKQWEKES